MSQSQSQSQSQFARAREAVDARLCSTRARCRFIGGAGVGFVVVGGLTYTIPLIVEPVLPVAVLQFAAMLVAVNGLALLAWAFASGGIAATVAASTHADIDRQEAEFRRASTHRRAQRQLAVVFGGLAAVLVRVVVRS